MSFQRGCRILCAGYVDAANRAGFTARYRDLSADYIGQIAFQFIACRLFCGLAQTGRAFGDDRGGQRHRVINTGHRGIKMDFAEAGGDVGFYQIDRFLHRIGSRLALPAVWTKVIAAENDTL